jgi:hypothetical protein
MGVDVNIELVPILAVNHNVRVAPVPPRKRIDVNQLLLSMVKCTY